LLINPEQEDDKDKERIAERVLGPRISGEIYIF